MKTFIGSIDMEFVLNDGNKIPAIAFGPGGAGYSPKVRLRERGFIENFCYRVYNKLYGRPHLYKNYVNAVGQAFVTGFRLLDYSASYGNGELIIKAMCKAGLQRSNLFITSRVSNRAQREHKVREEFFVMLESFKTDYVDLLQFHWPVTDLYLDTWKEIVKLQKDGYVKSIGVANCHQHHLDAIIKAEGVVPAVDQVEVHPLFTNKEIIEYCKEKGIRVEAYSPLARFDDRLFRLPVLKNIAKNYNKTIAQVILRWDIQNGQIPIVRSFNSARQQEDFDIFDFKLTQDEIAKIDAININARVRYDPDNCDFSIL